MPRRGLPAAEIEALGYNVETHGQKTFNGVAILVEAAVRGPRGLPGNEADAQSRYIEAVIPTEAGVVRLASVYRRTAIRSARRNTPTSSPSWTG